MTSTPRPIHTLHKPLRETPDESEPSHSYEETSFLAQKEDDVEDEFHRRFLASSSSSSNNNYNNNNTRLSDGGNNNSSFGSNSAMSSRGSNSNWNNNMDINPVRGRGPFWRTELTPQWQPRGSFTTPNDGTSADNINNNNKNNNKYGADHTTSRAVSITSRTNSSSQNHTASSSSSSSSTTRKGGGVMGRLIGRNSGGSASANGSANDGTVSSGGFPKRNTIPKRERKTSGGLLGAALQLHSQGNMKSVHSETSNRASGVEGRDEVRLLSVVEEYPLIFTYPPILYPPSSSCRGKTHSRLSFLFVSPLLFFITHSPSIVERVWHTRALLIIIILLRTECLPACRKIHHLVLMIPKEVRRI
jgi:hypothetical protein